MHRAILRSSLGCAIWSAQSPPRALMPLLPLASRPDVSLLCVAYRTAFMLAGTLVEAARGCFFGE